MGLISSQGTYSGSGFAVHRVSNGSIVLPFPLSFAKINCYAVVAKKKKKTSVLVLLLLKCGQRLPRKKKRKPLSLLVLLKEEHSRPKVVKNL